MGKSKEKKHKHKDAHVEGALGAKSPKDAAKPVGRQTNNSLASATGQILIQSVSNPNKKKMKTSQIFSQCEEDLQTGLHKILDHIKDHDDAWPFVDPVEEEYAPNYYSIVSKPMDLQKMEERLENGHYKTYSKFKTDFQLIVTNCRLYNGVNNEYTEMVGNLQESFERAVERYLDQVTSSDDEIAVEFQETAKHRKKLQEDGHKTKKLHKVDEITPEKKKRKYHQEENSEDDHEDDDGRAYKRKKDRMKEKVKEEKKRIKTEQLDQGKENKKVNKEEEMHSRKGKKRKVDVLEEHKSKKGEKDAKVRKEEVKRSKKDDKSRDRDKSKNKDHTKSKETLSKKYKKDKEDIKSANKAKAEKKSKKSLSRSSSRSRSGSRSSRSHRWSSSPPPSSPESMFSTPIVLKKLFYTKELPRDSVLKHKSKYDQWKEVFQPNLAEKDDDRDADALIKPKDKHNTLRETIEKLKAKSNLSKLQAEKDIRIYDFPNESKDKEKDGKVAKKKTEIKEEVSVKKKKTAKEQSGNEKKGGVDYKSKGKNPVNNSKKFDELSLATAQTLKDINKWLDDTPKFNEYSSTSNSPSHLSTVDDNCENNATKVSDLERKKTSDKLKNEGAKDATIANVAGNKKRPMNRDPSKLFRRKEIQRTIDRLQPGKSKGNLLTNVPHRDVKQDELFALGPFAKIKDTKNSLIVKTDDSAPKLSLGSVLDSFGKHKFIDDDKSGENEAKEGVDGEKVKASKASAKCADVKVVSPKLDKSPGTATPNLSAWFKAFGTPKVHPTTATTTTTTTKKVEVKIDDKPNEVEVTKKEDVRKTSPPDPSPNPDSPLMHGQPITRQRKISTGSSVSERSSFSQDMDSPRGGVDERLGAYPAPYPSPMHKSPASPNLRSPLPENSPKSYPFNGQIRVGFYQDTVSTKSSPDKSCSPRDNPQSPYAQYSELHVYTPPTSQNSNYSYNNAYYQGGANYSTSNPTPPYNPDTSAAYYDTTKPLTDQYQAKNPHSPTAGAQQSSQPNSPNLQPQPSPIDVQQHYQQPHSPVIGNASQDIYGAQQQSNNTQSVYQHQVITQQTQQTSQLEANYRGTTLDYGRQQAGPPNVEPFRATEGKIQQSSNSYPVKKRAYNETYTDDAYVNREAPPKYIHQNIPEPRSQLQHVQQGQAANQYSGTNYNYSDAPGNHQYSPINIPSAGRASMGVIEETRKIEMAKYSNMGYAGESINLQLGRNQHYKSNQNFVDDNGYKTIPQVSHQANDIAPRAAYSTSTGQLEMDQSLSLRGLSHIVDRYQNEDGRILSLQSNNPLSQSYYDKSTGQHMFAGKPSPGLPMFAQANTMPPYGVQSHANVYSQPAQQQQQQPQQAPQQTSQAQQSAVPATPEPKPKKKRLSKAAKAAAAAAAAQAQAQQAAVASNPVQQSVEPSVQTTQGFQTYAGLKNPSTAPSMEPSAISLKTASVVPGSAFNFGPSATGLPLPPSLYSDKDPYSNLFEDFRSPPNFYMVAHHRATPEAAEKSTPPSTRPSNVQPAPSVPSSASYPFLGAPQVRPPSYPALSGHFMPPPPHQAPLMDTSSPQYLPYLQAGVLHQGLLPPGAYTPGYHPALSIRQPYDSMTRPPWL